MFKLLEDGINGLEDSFEKGFKLNLEFTNYVLKNYKGEVDNPGISLNESSMIFDSNSLLGNTITNWEFIKSPITKKPISEEELKRIFDRVNSDFIPLFEYMGHPEWINAIPLELYDEKYKVKCVMRKCDIDDDITRIDFRIINILNTLKKQYTDIIYRGVLSGKLILEDVETSQVNKK